MVQIIGAIVTFFVFLTAPIPFLLFWLPLYLYRLFVFGSMKIFKLKSGMSLSPLDPISSILSADTIYSNPGINLCVSSTLEESNLTKRQIIQLFDKNLVQSKIDGRLRFPHLQQKIVSWKGINWWKPEKKFCIENHVYYIEDQSTNPVSLSEYLNKPFRKGLSPWDLLIIRSKSGPIKFKYEVRYRFHHVLHDGYSATEALSQLFSTKYDYYIPKSMPKTTICSKYTICNMFLPIKCIYEFISSELRTVEKTALDPKITCSNETFEVTTCSNIEVPFSRVSEIKQKFHVSSTAVLLASFSGGIRSWLQRNGHELPNYIKISIPVMIHGNREVGRTNQFSQIVLHLPVNEPNSTVRLLEIHREFLKTKNSTYAITSYYLTVGLGKLINPILRYILNNRPWPPFAVSCVVGPKEKLNSCGVGIDNVHVSMACKKYGVLLTIFSYNQSYQLNITANQNVIPTTSLLEELKDDINNEFLNLKNSNNKDFVIKM